MAFIYEVNGQRVEFDKEPTDADIDEAARSLGAPAPSGGGLQLEAEPSIGEIAAGAVSPAVTGAAYARPMNVNVEQLGKVAKPIWDTAKEAYKGPMGVVRGVADATLMAHGVPPLAGPYSAAENMTKRAQAVGQAMGEASKGLSQTPLTTAATGSTYPSGVPDYRAMQKAVPEASARLTEIYQKGGPNAVKAFLNSPEAAPFLKNPQFAAAAESYIGKVPGLFSQAGKIAGPVAVGAARVAGPVGMAATVYDAYPTAVKAAQGDTGAMVDTAKTAGELGLGYYAGKKLAEPSVIQRGMEMASKMREIAASKVMQGAIKGGVGAGAMLYSPGLNQGEEEELRRRRMMPPTIR